MTASRRRAVWIAVGAAAVLLGAFVGVRMLRVGEDDAPRGGAPAARREPPVVAAPAPALAGRPEVRAAGKPLEPREAGEPPAEAPAEPPAPWAPADGPVVVRAHAVEGSTLPGEVVLEAWPDGDEERRARTRLTGTPLSGRLARAATYTFRPLLEGWPEHDLVRDVPVPADGIVEIELAAPVNPVLVVVDAERGESVPGARAHRMLGNDSFMENRPIPSPESLKDVAAPPADAAGHIRLPTTTTAWDWWVGAPGRAWTRRRVPPVATENRVALPAGGGVHAVVVGWAALKDARIMIAPFQDPAAAKEDEELEPPSTDMAATEEEGSFATEGLRPGTWEVCVGRAGNLFLEEIWARARVEVFAGKASDVTIAVAPPAKIPLCTFDLELVVPGEWPPSERSVTLGGRGNFNDGERREWTISETAGSPWRARVEGVRQGAYILSIDEPPWQFAFRARPDTKTVRVDVPPPVRLRVRVLDSAGKPSVERPTAQVDVRPRIPPEDGTSTDDKSFAFTFWSGSVVYLQRDGDAPEFVGSAPAGKATLVVRAAGWADTSRELDLSPHAGDEVVEVRVPRSASILVRVVRKGAVVTDAAGFAGFGASDSETSNDIRNGTARFDGLAPGPYGVFCALRGPVGGVQRRTVDIHEGETVTVDFPADGK